jgi:uncharacterized protein YqhQ
LAEQQFFYGGQAVMEGVMIRGRRHFSLAVRRLDGQVYSVSEPLSQIYTGRLRRLPLVRGVVVLIETMALGIKALNRSAMLVLEDKTGEEEEVPRLLMGAALAVAFALGIGLFFIMPLFATRPLEDLISSEPLVNLIEGLIRLVVLVAYIGAIGLLKDIRRLFAYHGAEHMAVHTHEAGLPLEVDYVRRFPTAHPRCGTAFLLTVMVVAILVFTFVGRDPLWWLVLSRVVFIPVIAATSYEVIRFSGAHHRHPLARLLAAPGLLLQSMTTRPPDDGQIEVAINAMETALAADEGRAAALHPSPTAHQSLEAGPAEGG